MIFQTLKECQDTIDMYTKAGLPVPADWYTQLATLLSGGAPSIPVVSTSPIGVSSGIVGPISIYDYLKDHTPYSSSLQQCIEDTVSHLLNPTNPNEDTSIPGLLLGRIQSGKTRAFIGVMALAFDKGIDACIVLTKPDNGLVEQTKARLDSEFEHFLDDTIPYNNNIVRIYDVNKKTTLSGRERNFKNIFVLHKNSRLDLMKSILDLYFLDKKILIIDDEADFVSRTFYTRKKVTTGGITGFRIDELTNNPRIDCYYLQVTATPYSLILQPDDVIEVSNGEMSCFKPRFTTLVPTHSEYVGGKEYFEDALNPASMYSYLFHPIDNTCFDYMLAKNNDVRITRHPESHVVFEDLRYALMQYFVSSAIRQIQQFRIERRTYKSSMLIHCATEKGDHTHEQKLINHILNEWQKLITNNSFSTLQPLFNNAFYDIIASLNAGIASHELPSSPYIPTLQEVENKIKLIFQQCDYNIICVNGNTTDDPNMYTKTGQLKLTGLLNIFIGGYKADRGITIDGLISFMYGRRPQNGGAANTILQHMRQYGKRSKEDMAVTRFHTTNELHQKMIDIYHTDEALRDFFAQHSSPKIISIDYNPYSGYKLCSPNLIRLSDIYGYRPFGRVIATGGMQTKTGIASTINSLIAQLQRKEPNPKTPFKVSKLEVIDWIRQIRGTFEYNSSKYNNCGIDWDEEIMIGAIEKYCPVDGKIWCYYKLGMGLNRQDASGFADDPEDGNTDTQTAKKYATDRPFLMLIGEKGSRVDGWRDEAFLWPVLRLPSSASSSIFCRGVAGAPRSKSEIEVIDSTGALIKGKNILDTMILCINVADPGKVQALNILYRKNNLIYSAGRKPKDYDTIVKGSYYIRKGIPAIKAKEILDNISTQIGLGWVVNII